MHYKIKLLSLLLFVSSCGLLCSCQETPQEVTDRMEDYGENKQIKEEFNLTYCKPEELKNAGIPDIETGNIELPEAVDFSGIEDVALLHLSYESDFFVNRDKYLKLFGINKKSFVKSVNVSGGINENYDEKKAKKGFNISENGFISYYAGVTYDYVAGGDEEEELQVISKDEYAIDYDDLSGVKIAFKDGEAELLNMCQEAEKWLAENMPVPQLEYHVSDALTRTFIYPGETKENPVLSLCAELEYKGIRLNNHVNLVSDDTNDVITGCDVNINYDSPGNITFFSNGKGRPRVDSAESLEKIVDFESCVKLVNKTMADFNKLKVERIIPLYVIHSTCNFDNEDYIDNPGKKVEARPVYAFLFDKREENEDLGISKEYEHFVLVDMETGELTTDFRN